MIRHNPAGRRPGHPRRDDYGFTVLEMVITTAIMSLCMAVITAGLLQVYRVVNKNESISTGQSQLHIAFLRLDKEIHYAAGISVPAAVGVDPYVGYLVPTAGIPVCVELRLRVAALQLQRRSWIQGSAPLTPSAWIPLASNLSAVQPFRFWAADPTFGYQRLEVSLTTNSGAGVTASSTHTHVPFPARNTSLATSTATVCTEGRAIP